jgi:hypothetical protein
MRLVDCTTEALLAGFDNSYHASNELVLINTDNSLQTPSGTQSLHGTPHGPGMPPITGALFLGSRQTAT